MKTCLKCGVEKDDSYFSKHKSGKDGLRPWCKKCIKIASAVYYAANKIKINAQNKKYWAQNKEALNAWQKQYTVDHRDDKHQYYIDNKETIYVKKRVYENTKLNNDVSFKLRKNISNSIRSLIKKLGGSKSGASVSKYLPYSIQELREHLEKQFEPWMNWGNHGAYDPEVWDDNDMSTWTWQIDHIIPQSDLLYTSMEDDNFKRCWALENLRPLNAKSNLLDGVRRVRHRK